MLSVGCSQITFIISVRWVTPLNLWSNTDLFIWFNVYISDLCFQVILHDMILKNIEKIKKPRNSNAEALYWQLLQNTHTHTDTYVDTTPELNQTILTNFLKYLMVLGFYNLKTIYDVSNKMLRVDRCWYSVLKSWNKKSTHYLVCETIVSCKHDTWYNLKEAIRMH